MVSGCALNHGLEKVCARGKGPCAKVWDVRAWWLCTVCDKVCKHPLPPSWQDASAMYNQVRSMPGAPCWKADTIALPEAPTEPQILYWCDPVECAHFLFQNPDFVRSMAYVPSRLYDKNETHMYTEMTTGEEWPHQQVCPNY